MFNFADGIEIYVLWSSTIIQNIIKTLSYILSDLDKLKTEWQRETGINSSSFNITDTLEYMNSEFLYPKLMDRERTDTWENEGKTELFHRATKSAQQILNNHFQFLL